jgi:hypothetical protein
MVKLILGLLGFLGFLGFLSLSTKYPRTYRFIVKFITAESNSVAYGGTSVPPPAKLTRNGVLEKYFTY